MLVPRALPFLLGLAAFGIGALAPTPACADEPQPLVRFDPDAVPPESTRTKVLLLGSAMTALSYGGALGASYLWSEDAGAADLRIPVIGPWIKLGHTTLCASEEFGCNNVMQVLGAVLVGFDGLGQIGGLALLSEGIFGPAGKKQAAFRGASASAGGTFSSYFTGQLGDVSFVPLPFVQAGSDVGLGVVGTF